MDGAARSGDTVHFNSEDPEIAEIDPFLIRVHAALAQVLHMSGAAEAIDKILRDRDEFQQTVLARDGSDAEFLAAQLSMIAAY